MEIFHSILWRVHNTQGKPGKSGENMEKLKNQGKPGKREEIPGKIKARRENPGKILHFFSTFWYYNSSWFIIWSYLLI